ncbi:unnamed protein product [Ambrosiozyma monospora]|uniref:Unnamed protein product n=1 Tax=Ambrosiozyma monospora TaxID=43982 RepID=A0ACB5T7G4_AMBMO|nr:unnamed protein product [Ambrosiozyma monospora]
MQLYYIGIIRPANESTKTKTVVLSSAKELSSFSFFQRTSVGQFMDFFATTVAERTKPQSRQTVEENNYVAHCFSRSEGLAAVIITDKDYPVRPAYSLLNNLADTYITQHPAKEWANVAETSPKLEFDGLNTYLTKYQNPSEADSLMKVQQELDDTKIVLQKSIESVLQRGEQLDSLVDKSEALSNSSKTFYKQAKKTNSCCVIM